MTRAATRIERYLARHAESEAALAGALPSRHGHALTVPVYDEGDSFFRLLSSLASGSSSGPLGSTLVIAVVNARDDSGEAVLERNRLLQSRKPTTVAAVALANKTARIVRALLRHGGTYQNPAPVPAA